MIFVFRFAGWSLRWTIATIFMLAAMGIAGWYVFDRAVSGGEYVTVPNIGGLPLDEAVYRLTTSGLTLGDQTPMNSEDAPKGQVISQRPAAGQVVRTGRKVFIVVSGGPDQLAAPDVVGQPLEAARAALEKEAFKTGNVAYVPDVAPKDVVLSQDPAPGHAVPREGSINLLVSSGAVAALAAMPDLVGKPLGDALRIVATLGVTAVPNAVDNPDVPTNVILAQRPAPGTTIQQGDQVSYDVRPSGAGQLTNARRKVELVYGAPASMAGKPIRFEYIDRNQVRKMIYQGTIQAPAPDAAGSANERQFRVPLAFFDEITVEVYVDDSLVRTYQYKGNAPCEVVDYGSGRAPAPPEPPESQEPAGSVEPAAPAPVADSAGPARVSSAQYEVVAPSADSTEKGNGNASPKDSPLNIGE